MSEDKNSFVFFRSFHEAIKEMPKKHQLAIYQAIVEYALDNREPSLSGPASALWKSFRPQIDSSAKRYANAKKGAKYGKLGGRPKKNTEEEKPLKGYEGKTPNVDVYVDVNDDVDVDVDANASGSDEAASQSGTTPKPSFKEVADEVAAKGFRVSSSKFFEHYEKNGWKTNEGEPIRDWKKMLAVWDMKERFGVSPESSGKSKPKKNAFNSFDQREYSNDDLEARYLSKG